MDKAPTVGPLSTSELSLLRAARVWLGDGAIDLWGVFRPDRRDRLVRAWEEGEAADPEPPLGRLRREHAAQAKPDMQRVHVSWWVRALKTETPSVQRAVVASLPKGIAEVLQDELGLRDGDLEPDRPASPLALRTAQTLWAERLIGDLPDRADDPPVIAALTRFDARTVSRMIHTAGLAKWSLTDEAPTDLETRDRERFQVFHAAFRDPDPRFLKVAERDVAAVRTGAPRPVMRLGLVTFARLLSAAEPLRARWALQHIAYPTARSIRTLIGPSARKANTLAGWEAKILRAVWEELHAEGRLLIAWGASS